MDQNDHPFLIGPMNGEPPQMGTLVSLLRSSRHFLLSASRGLTQPELDARTSVPNSTGAILAHVLAAETLIRNVTFHGTRFGEAQAELRASFAFERNPLQGRDLAAYREALSATRRETLRLLGGVDDDWLSAPKTFMGEPNNVHYDWMHLVQDEVRHTGQIILVRKYLLPTSDPEFDPYVPPDVIGG